MSVSSQRSEYDIWDQRTKLHHALATALAEPFLHQEGAAPFGMLRVAFAFPEVPGDDAPCVCVGKTPDGPWLLWLSGTEGYPYMLDQLTGQFVGPEGTIGPNPSREHDLDWKLAQRCANALNSSEEWGLTVNVDENNFHCRITLNELGNLGGVPARLGLTRQGHTSQWLTFVEAVE